MSTAKQHTPGPWTLQTLDTAYHGYPWQTFAVRSPQNVCLAVVGDVDRFESERIPANARLIAAAPELLEALETLTSVIGLTPLAGNVEALQEAFNLARTAIAKAKGENK